MCNFGKTGAGKTNSFYGIDSLYNDSEPNFNIINSFYKKLKISLKSGEESLYVFSLSIIEILYNEDEKIEIIKDLLDVSSKFMRICISINNLCIDNMNNDSFSKGILSVIFKTEEEMEQILYFSRLRSENWRSNEKYIIYINTIYI